MSDLIKRKLTDAERAYRARQDAWINRFVDDIHSRLGIKRSDTNTALFTRSLAKILATLVNRRYPKLNMLEILPASERIDMGVESVVSRGHEIHGAAGIMTSYQTEIPTVTVSGHEQFAGMYPIAAKFQIFYQDLAAAAFAGVPLSTKVAAAAHRVVAEGLDLGLAFGSASAGITGMINNVTISGAGPGFARVIQGGTTVGTTGSWAFPALCTNAQLVADFAFAIDIVETGSLFKVDTVAVSPQEHARLIAPESAIGYLPNLKAVLEASYGVKIISTERLRAVPAALTPSVAVQNRAVFFESNTDVFNALVSVGPEQYPPAVGPIGYDVVVHQRCGGVDSMNPLGAVYFDMA